MLSYAHRSQVQFTDLNDHNPLVLAPCPRCQGAGILVSKGEGESLEHSQLTPCPLCHGARVDPQNRFESYFKNANPAVTVFPSALGWLECPHCRARFNLYQDWTARLMGPHDQNGLPWPNPTPLGTGELGRHLMCGQKLVAYPAPSVLFMAGSPEPSARSRMWTAVREVQRALVESRQAERFDLLETRACLKQDEAGARLTLTARLLDPGQTWAVLSPRVVQLVGFKSSNRMKTSQLGKTALCWEVAEGTVQPIPAADLQGLFQSAGHGIEVLLLDAPHAPDQLEALKAALPAVIVIPLQAGELEAQRFAGRFYTSLGEGSSVEQAYQAGCDSLRVLGFSHRSLPTFYH